MTKLFEDIKTNIKSLTDDELSKLDIVLWAEVNSRDPAYFAYEDDTLLAEYQELPETKPKDFSLPWEDEE